MLRSLLVLAFRLGVEPISLLAEDLCNRVNVNAEALNLRVIPQAKSIARRHSRKKLRSTLQKILEAEQNPPFGGET